MTTAAKAVAAQKKRSTRAKVKLNIDKRALRKIKLVAVAYSYVQREMFATEDAYQAEIEVEDRAQELIKVVESLGIPVKGYPADAHVVAALQIDHPDVVINLVDTVRGSDLLGTSVPAALELASIPYTGAGMEGLVIGNSRQLTKQLLSAFSVPTPDFQFIRRAGTAVDQSLGLPLIVKLNESGGSVGIDDHAVRETYEDAQQRVDELIAAYKLPVVIEQFVDGTEVNVIVFDDGKRRNVFMAAKRFKSKVDGKHSFTTQTSYQDEKAWKYEPVADEALAAKITSLAQRAFTSLMHRDYGKFDIRVDEKTGTPYFIDSNPNTAFGPQPGTPIRDILHDIYNIPFEDVLASLLSKYARKATRS